MKRIVFLTGTRADFGKMKSLINIASPQFDVHIFATGMHLHKTFGSTVEEIEKNGYKNIYKYINQSTEESMDLTLANTIDGFSRYVKEHEPDLIVIHGDRVEALAGSIVGALNNILVAHIEGGEVSGTIDELIRHSVSKMSHIHLVANETAKRRLIQMGEAENSIYIIGSPDVDIMLSNKLESIEKVKNHYQIPFEEYAVVLFHPVTTEADAFKEYAHNLVNALLNTKKNYVVIFPNNDLGSKHIIEAYANLHDNVKFRVYPSIRFEYFLVLLKNAQFIVGNSSAGIREAPYYGVPTINIGSRQDKRSDNKSILNSSYETVEISSSIMQLEKVAIPKSEHFGNGSSDEKFLELLKTSSFWDSPKQKQFKDLSF